MRKKVFAVLCAAGMLFGTARAEVDISGLSYAELVTLQEQVTKQIMLTDQWQEVRVPAGAYLIGREIPAGKWTMAPQKGQTAIVMLGWELNDVGTSFDHWAERVQITDHTDSYAEYNPVESVSWELKDGMYLVIEDCSVIFTPYAGPSFSFK